MINELLENIIYEYSYFTLFGITLAYFLVLYLGLAPLFDATCRFLASKGLLEKIAAKEVPRKQIKYEIRHSLQSVFLFGFTGIPIVWGIREGVIHILPNTALNVLLGLVLLTAWNELHFFLVHRLMHLPWWMRNVHYIHHRSHVPTVYSIYSFHWLEAALLSTVPLTFALLFPLAPMAVFLYPLISVLLNYAGHCNYRFGKGTGPDWLVFGTHHAEHHHKGRQNFGFASHLPDWLYRKLSGHRPYPNNPKKNE